MKLLEESCEHYKWLYRRMVASTRDVMRLSQLVEEMQMAHLKFAQNLEEIASKFHEQISGGGRGGDEIGESSESDGLLFAYQHLSNYLLKLSSSHQNLSTNVSSEIIEPLKMFIENFRQTNRETSSSAKDQLADLEKKREKLGESQKIFWNARKTAEEYSETIEKTAELIDKGLKKQDELQRVTHRSVELKFLAEEAQEEYRGVVNQSNLLWESFAVQFPQHFTRFEYNDESRIAFSRQTINKLIQYLQSQNQQDLNSSIQYQERFNELDKQIVSENKPHLWNIISNNTNEEFVKKLNSFQEKFISYDSWKKTLEQVQQTQQDKIGQQSSKEAMNSSREALLSNKDKMKILTLLAEILGIPKTQLIKQANSDAKKSLQAKYEASLSELGEYKNLQKQKQSKQKGESNSSASTSASDTLTQNCLDEDEDVVSYDFKAMFNSSASCEFFVEKFSKSIGQKGRFYEELSDEAFSLAVLSMQSVLSWIAQESKDNITSQADKLKPPSKNLQIYNSSLFTGVLHIVSRITKRQKTGSTHKELLSHFVNESRVFQDVNRWESLFDDLKSKKIEDKKRKLELLKQSDTTSLMHVNKNITKTFKMISSGLGKLGGLSKLGGLFYGNNKKEEELNQQQEEEKNLQSEVSYQVLEELNKHLLNLELTSQFTAELILNLAKKKNASIDLIPRLLEKQENKKNSEMRRNFQNYKNKKKRLEDKINLISGDSLKVTLFIIKNSLQFLSTKDKPWNLLLVSKAFNTQLKKQLFKQYLFRDCEQEFLSKNRVTIWLKVLNIDNLRLDYVELKNNSDLKSDKKPDSIEEIIKLDVQRSLHLHQDKIKPEQLQNLLKVFAIYNPEISYCQGMNYIAGFLYLTIQNENQTYKAFHMVMNNFFSTLLTDSFEHLKVVFYQLERLLMIFLPELAEHLKQEGVDTNYYATSWFITIFSSVFQYTKDSYLLSIIWDIFLCEGWKGFFKCVLWVLRFLQPKLLLLDFDEILHTMSDLIRVNIFMSSKENLIERGILTNVNNIKTEIASFKITNSLLANLEKEHKCFTLNLKKKLQDIA